MHFWTSFYFPFKVKNCVHQIGKKDENTCYCHHSKYVYCMKSAIGIALAVQYQYIVLKFLILWIETLKNRLADTMKLFVWECFEFNRSFQLKKNFAKQESSAKKIIIKSKQNFFSRQARIYYDARGCFDLNHIKWFL